MTRDSRPSRTCLSSVFAKDITGFFASLPASPSRSAHSAYSLSVSPGFLCMRSTARSVKPFTAILQSPHVPVFPGCFHYPSFPLVCQVGGSIKKSGTVDQRRFERLLGGVRVAGTEAKNKESLSRRPIFLGSRPPSIVGAECFFM